MKRIKNFTFFSIFSLLLTLSCTKKETDTSDPDNTCTTDNTISTTNIGCCENPSVTSVYNETVNGDERILSSNSYPNHQFCSTRTTVDPLTRNVTVDATPSLAGTTSSILSDTGRPRRFFAMSLNGVLMAPAPAEPFIFENTDTGEYNWDWVFEPINNQGSGMNLVDLDCASAHVGPQGYHYHGNMFQYIEEAIQSGLSTTSTPPSDPVQIGWAADGYPILYRFGPDGSGNLTLLQPSFRLKSGERPGDGISAPCGEYNGKYTNDYEYVNGIGDLDECNGIQRNITLNTSNGPQTFDYFYVITDAFPQISRCHSGTPNASFNN